MEQRLYYSAPNLDVAQKFQQIANQLEIAEDNFSVVSLDSAEIKRRKLHEADYIKKLDFVRCGIYGTAYGFAAGAIVTTLLVMFQPYGFIVPAALYWVPIAMCTSFGLWSGIMTGLASINVNLKSFRSKLKKGGSVVIVDVNNDRSTMIKEIFHEQIPQATLEKVTDIDGYPFSLERHQRAG